MRLLIVTQYFWPENFRINDLVQGLLEREHDVTVLTGIPNYPQGKFFSGYGLFRKTRQNYHGARVVRIPIIPRLDGSGLGLALNFIAFAISASLLGPLLCRKKYDLIFVYEPSPVTVCLPALVLKKLRRIPVMFWVQDLWPESLEATGSVRSKTILQLVGRLVRFIYCGCDRILLTSRAFWDSVEKLGGDPGQMRYFPQYAEELYCPVSVPDDAPERTVMPAGFRVVFAGNIGAAQDFGTIISAAEKLKSEKEIHWVIIGDGRMRSWVAKEIKERGLEEAVHLLGQYPAEAMPRFFALADALLMTLRREPIFSLTVPGKVQSYLACSRPVVAGIDGEGARIVEEAGAGIACPAEDPDALAGAVLDLYRMSEEERRTMGERGRAYFEEHFERSRLLDRLERWMEELAVGKSAETAGKEAGCNE